jgi:hypothetical protein
MPFRSIFSLVLRFSSFSAASSRRCAIITKASEEDTIVEVQLVPADVKNGSLADQAREMERVMAAWHAVPNERMRDSIELFKYPPRASSYNAEAVAGLERVGGATLDQRTDLLFETLVVSTGKWNLVAVISAGAADLDRIFRAWQGRIEGAATRPSSRPVTRP